MTFSEFYSEKKEDFLGELLCSMMDVVITLFKAEVIVPFTGAMMAIKVFPPWGNFA